MSSPLIRKGTKDDLPAIVALLADDMLGATRETASGAVDPAYLAGFAAIEGDPNHAFIVLEQSGIVLGCMQLSFIPGLSLKGMWRGQIESVRVAADHRGRGLGRMLMTWAIAECRERGCGLVQLTSNAAREDAIRFYESLGFRPTHSGLKLMLGD